MRVVNRFAGQQWLVALSILVLALAMTGCSISEHAATSPGQTANGSYRTMATIAGWTDDCQGGTLSSGGRGLLPVTVLAYRYNHRTGTPIAEETTDFATGWRYSLRVPAGRYLVYSVGPGGGGPSPTKGVLPGCWLQRVVTVRAVEGVREHAGLDPEIGYLHSNRKGRLSLVYDLMEPMRPVVDRVVLTFVNEQTFSATDFPLSERGVCRLHPQLARRLVEILPRSDALVHSVADLLSTLESIALREAG